jgi:hypothetical protein
MKHPENDKWLDDALSEAIGSEEARTDFEAWKQKHPEAVEMLTARADKEASASPSLLSIRKIIMKSPITKLAAAAVITIACLTGLFFWKSTGSGIALADVLARIEQVKAYRYKWSMKVTGRTGPDKPLDLELHTTELISQEHGTRKSNYEEVDPNGGVSTVSTRYLLPQKKTLITIFPEQKKYLRKELDDAEVEREVEERKKNDPRAMIKRILKCKYESLGRSTIDGIEVEGFQTRDPNYFLDENPDRRQFYGKIWVDVKTRLPARFESNISQDVDRMENKIHSHFMMHDFKWDVLVDAAEFEPVIPDDYTRKADIPVKRPAATEENVIKALKLFADLSGNYPARPHWPADRQWSAFEKSDTPAARRLQEEIKGLTEDEKANRLRDALQPLQGLHRFYRVLRVDGMRPAYYGMTVTPKDADKVLLRWKVSDNEYRVIFGDLRAKTVTLEQLAELEKGLKQ